MDPSAVSRDTLRWVLGLSFLGMAIWTMIPDQIEEEETRGATVAVAAHYATPLPVVVGMTLDMLIADGPAVFIGDKLATKIPMRLVHTIAAAIFALLGTATLLGAGAHFGS